MIYVLIAALLVGALALALAFSWRTVVPPSKVHVVQRRKSSTAYGRNYSAGNVYYNVPSFVPYYGVMAKVMPIDIFDITLPSYEAYDKSKVPFNVEVKAFFQIEEVVEAAQRIDSFEELQTQLRDTMQGAIRKVLAAYPIEEIMVNRKELGEQFSSEVIEQVKNWGVKLNSMEFMNITDANDSNVISDIMRKEISTIDRESRVKVAENEKQAKMAELESAEAIGVRDVDRKRTIAIRDQEAIQSVEEQKKATREREMAVVQVETVRQQEIEKERMQVESEARAAVAKIEADGKAEAARREAAGYKDAETSRGAGEASRTEQVGTAEAEVIRQKAVAEADGKEKLALALQKYNDAATVIEKLNILRDIEQAKWLAYGQVAENADIKVVQSGKGADILGFPVNAESGADLEMFLDQLRKENKGLDLGDLAKRAMEKVSGRKDEQEATK